MDASAADLSILVGELRSIRLASYAILAVLVVIAIVVCVRTVFYLRSLARNELGNLFNNVAREHFHANELETLVEYALLELKKRPNHAYAHWWLARGYLKQGRLDEAEAELGTTLRLAPEWQDGYIDPYFREIERQRKQGADTAGQSLVI